MTIQAIELPGDEITVPVYDGPNYATIIAQTFHADEISGLDGHLSFTLDIPVVEGSRHRTSQESVKVVICAVHKIESISPKDARLVLNGYLLGAHELYRTSDPMMTVPVVFGNYRTDDRKGYVTLKKDHYLHLIERMNKNKKK